jgi:hypothetical protein
MQRLKKRVFAIEIEGCRRGSLFLCASPGTSKKVATFFDRYRRPGQSRRTALALAAARALPEVAARRAPTARPRLAARCSGTPAARSRRDTHRRARALEMNIEIARRAEALDQRHGARRAARTSEPGFLENASQDRAVHDAEHLRQRFGVSCKQEPQRERQREHPLAQRLLREHFVRQQCGAVPSSAALRRRGKSPGVCN